MANDVRTRLRARTRGALGRPAPPGPDGDRDPLAELTAGGTEGNERLTVIAGLVLVVLLAALGITIIRIGSLIWLHLFLGYLLLGPLALKLASTGYRFVRYYTHDQRYRVKGPPAPALRIMAPVVVLLTLAVFVTGIVLLAIGPGSGSRSTMVLLHKVTFIAWIVFAALHVLGHLPEILRFLRISNDTRLEMLSARNPRPQDPHAPVQPLLRDQLPGASGRWLSVSTALVVGLVLAIALAPSFDPWTAAHAFPHHHHHFH